MIKGGKRSELDLCSSRKSDKKDALDKTLSLIKLGKGKGELRELLKISPSALSNRLKRLDEFGCIELMGKYGMKYISSSHKHPEVTRNQVHKKLNKRGHATNFTILFPNESDELRAKDKVLRESRKKRITKLENGCFRLEYKGYTIWINKKTLTIYSNNYYSSKDALHSKFRQLKEVDNLVKYLKERYEIHGIYGIEIFREHYGLVFNKFAEWILKRKGKMTVKDKGDKAILWVDDSMKDDIGLKEFEGKDAADINTADKFFDSHEQTGWKNDAHVVEGNKAKIDNHDKVLEKTMKVLEGYTEQIALHLVVEQQQLITQKATQKTLKDIRDFMRKSK